MIALWRLIKIAFSICVVLTPLSFALRSTPSTSRVGTALASWRLTRKSGAMGQPGQPQPQQQQQDNPSSHDGELYFQPGVKASIKVPPGKEALVGKQRIISLLPYGQVLAPTGSDWLSIFEMKHRMLLNEKGVFGFCYYSSTQNKLALVGTLASVKERKILDDGRSFVVIEGLERFYIDEVVSERPYLKARVQVFSDYTEASSAELDELETKLLIELRKNMKMMEKLFPSKSFSITPTILANRPTMALPGVRSVKMIDEKSEMERRTRFSMAVLDMLQISSTVKLSLLQEHVLERRLTKFLKILRNGGTYLAEELAKKGLGGEVNGVAMGGASSKEEEEVSALVSAAAPSQDYGAANFKDDEWILGPMMM